MILVDAAKNHFRESGGLGYVLSMLTSKDDDEVKVTILYTLGCATERNGKLYLWNV